MNKQNWGHWPGLLNTKQNKNFFGEYSAFQPCPTGIYEVGGKTLGEGERVNADVFIQINLHSKHSYKTSGIQISTSVLQTITGNYSIGRCVRDILPALNVW